ncbi:16S rRNA (guanine(527)-N(7))-methyltransferase RsmG [Clostridium botulinum]|uniref:Ribosomal RNA small subunit methyltransferase G n=1 Tax=Clostridium botulinum TaxID=1491 RepID=A0A6G4HXU9_CLOBO|nr:16S rRNA (guanine(527)-N(7))-methyltransferase RsmG [Clostridium botulinum]MBD5589504.1 16S rRNA (guanine(527)-N(7))-methyltransferase RsmG [Clostridium botulinum]MBO0581446.1 16S rRNA (guanine(527)-N(7))-methyltransferase RsmG [Clostridium botulinum]NFJ61331.1 16S rRNA (guanine(527)-N(7))-methyltransferase RsmG [Clostridium botulinum]NFJ68373.1 16S rRNA (guanine(527)-N(7))-methyltransferase RsmG [Clostridium botulinum]NFQ65514.1 16S rRNA (guanine(527)-N(7))-methyltransferase RsmG [Clostrid
MEFFNILQSACNDVNLDFNDKKYNQLISYKNLIQEWNKKINLTAIVEDDEIIKKHFIDCIKIFKSSPIGEAKSLIDIGTGAGFPGIPIKILKEDIEITLLDSLQKRINFLNTVIGELQLKNIQCLHGRAEDHAQEIQHRQKYDIAVSRAVANLAVLSEFCIPFVEKGGYFIAMKGPSVEEEITAATKSIEILGGKIEDIIKIDIEDTDLKHNLVIIKKVKETGKRYPRKPGIIKKNPLK